MTTVTFTEFRKRASGFLSNDSIRDIALFAKRAKMENKVRKSYERESERPARG